MCSHPVVVTVPPLSSIAEKPSDEHDPTGRLNYQRLCEKMGVVPVSYFCRHITDPEITMRYHGLGPQGTRAIARVLRESITVERLNLAGNWMEGEGGMHMARMLSENEYITDLVRTHSNLIRLKYDPSAAFLRFSEHNEGKR